MLFSSLKLMPEHDMSLEDQIDCMIRLVFLIFALLYLTNAKYSVHFLTGSLIFIIILFLLQRKPMNKCENYKSPYERVCKQQGKALSGSIAGDSSKLDIVTSLSTTFLAQETPYQHNNPNYTYKNQLLAKGANPITNIPPVVVAPSHDLENWRANPLINHSAVNKMAQRDQYLSGYAVTTQCAENYSPPPPLTKVEMMANRVREMVEKETLSREMNGKGVRDGTKECFSEQVGSVNTACGYNPSQLKRTNIPNNVPVGNCQQQPSMRHLNENLFTQTVQPGVYAKYNVAEPINSNMGISFQQQFEPVSCSVDKNGITFTNEDPNVIVPLEEEMCPGEEVRYDNVYDPRFSGYGTSYRSYIDPMTGQPRFAYDDVDAVRRPNYITRSKIDFLPFADTYGSLKEGNEYGNDNTANIKQMVQDSYVQNNMMFRNDMMERLMRKRNAELWQLRSYPKAGGRAL
jgi:hypothetical protein